MTLFPLAEMFPKESYRLARPNNRLHYLIALNQPEESIDTVLKKGPDLEARDPVYGLTPLAVAAMAGNANMVDKFLRLGANPLPLDKIHWTPLHYAEVSGNEQIKQMLKTTVKINKLPNLEEIRRVLSPQWAKPTDQVVLIQTQKKQLVPLSASGFAGLTDSAFSDEMIASPKSLVDYWHTASSIRDSAVQREKHDYLAAKFLKCRDKLPRLALKKEGLQVITTKRIPSCGIIGFHGGKIDPILPGETRENTDSRLEELDADKLKNLPSMVKDGLPNCYIDRIQVGGINYHILIACRQIEVGEELRVDFGPNHTFKYKSHPVPPSTISFFRENSPRSLYDKVMDSDTSSIQKLVELEGVRAQLRYLFSTPFLIIELIKEKALDPKDIHAMINDPDIVRILELSEAQVNSISIILESIVAINEKLNDMPETIGAQILENVYSFVKTQPIHIVVQFMDQLIRHLPDVVDESSWDQVFATLNENAIAIDVIYDWLKDESSDAAARVALQSIDPKDQVQFSANMKYLIQGNFPYKLRPFLMMKGAVGLSEWAKDPNHEFKRLAPLAELTYAECLELYNSKRPHIEHKYPNLLNSYDKLLNSLLEQMRKS